MMQLNKMTTNETMRSMLSYGTPEYPFEYYFDELKKYKSHCIEWHWHNEFELSYVKQGRITCYFKTEHIVLDTGDGLFINSGNIHRFESDEDGILENFIFSPEFIAQKDSFIFTEYVKPFFVSNCSVIPFYRCDDNLPVMELFEQISACCVSSEDMKKLRIRNLIGEIWEYIYMHAEKIFSDEADKNERTAQVRLQKMLQYISVHYMERISLSDIALHANVSRSEALRCFRQGISMPPIRYLNDYRLNRARELLLTTEDAVSSISESVGFEDPGYFCRLFKRKFGTSPTAYRKDSDNI